jgi:hypothetical protein
MRMTYDIYIVLITLFIFPYKCVVHISLLLFMYVAAGLNFFGMCMELQQSRDSSISIATRLRAGRWGF